MRKFWMPPPWHWTRRFGNQDLETWVCNSGFCFQIGSQLLVTHIIRLPLRTAGLISTHRVKNHLLFRILSKCLIWAWCFITWHRGRIYLERRLRGKPPSTSNPKLFLPVQWQVPARRSKPIGMAAAGRPSSPAVFPANAAVELVCAKQG